MSINPDSPFNKAVNDRGKIRDCTWDSSNTNTSKKHCLICPGIRLIIKEIDGQKKWWCYSCGQSTPVEPGSNTNMNDKYQSKYGSTKPTHTFMISKDFNNNKKRKAIGSINDSLDEEDIRDLRSMGINVS